MLKHAQQACNGKPGARAARRPALAADVAPSARYLVRRGAAEPSVLPTHITTRPIYVALVGPRWLESPLPSTKLRRNAGLKARLCDNLIMTGYKFVDQIVPPSD